MILSMVSEGDLEDSVLDLVLAMLLVCWRVRERDSVVNQGASSCRDNNLFIMIIYNINNNNNSIITYLQGADTPHGQQRLPRYDGPGRDRATHLKKQQCCNMFAAG